MKVSTRIVVEIASGRTIEQESYEYTGPTAQCFSIGGGGSKQKSKQKSESHSGVRYNEDFLNRATDWANSKSSPGYDPQYVGSEYTKGEFTPVSPLSFDKLENTMYDTQASKLSQAYNQAINRQREELAQTGGLNSPSQYLEGGVRASTDKDFISSLQQAARDATMGRLGLQQTEAGRRTAFDVGEATRRTGYDVGEAGRETAFNQDVQGQLLNAWLKKLALAIESGRFSDAMGEGSSSGSSGQGNFSFLN